MTKKTKQLYDELLADLEDQDSAEFECFREDWPSAKALERRGLLKIETDRDVLTGTFMVIFRRAGSVAQSV